MDNDTIKVIKDELLTVKEVADILKLKERVIYDYVDKGMFDIVRCSKKVIRIKKYSLDKFIGRGGTKKNM
jgi:excisionase family DNA binding protein